MVKTALLLFCGFMFGLAGIFLLTHSPTGEPKWVGELEALGLVDRLGNPDSETHFLVVTSYECAPCVELLRLVLPEIKEGLYRGDIYLTLVTIVVNTELQKTILEVKKKCRDVDPELLILLTEYLVEDYQELASDPQVNSSRILKDLGLGDDFKKTGLNWEARIESSFPILEKAGLSTVPLWFINFRRIKGTPNQIVEKVELAMMRIEKQKELLHR